MSKKFRRLVTGHDAAGKSIFVQDDEAQSTLGIAIRGDLTVTDFWETTSAPADNQGDADNADRPVHLEPEPTGTIFRMVEFPPDAGWKDGSDGKEIFDALGAEHVADESHEDPGMHKTSTVDYALVVAGEIWAVLDQDERLMRAGDVLVQRGTNHAWSNRTAENCVVMFVLCGANPV